MIILDGVTALTASRKNARPFLSDVDLILPSDRRIALLGTGREETAGFMHLLSGLLPPRAGRVIRQSKVSFPVGFLGGFVATLPVRENVAYLARLYDADGDAILSFMRKIAKLGPVFDKPYGQLPKQTKADLAQILAYALPFDTYLLLQQPKPSTGNDGDASYELFQARRRAAGMIIPTRSKAFADQHCELGLVFENGKLRLFDNVEEAFRNLPAIKDSKLDVGDDEDQSDADASDDISLVDMTSSAQQETGPELTKAERRRARRRRLALREKRLARKRAARGNVA